MQMATDNMVTIPRRTIARWRAATALVGLGQATSFVGLGWDYYVHEIARVPPESLFAAPHLLIFGGIGVSALGFLLSLVGLRLRPEKATA